MKPLPFSWALAAPVLLACGGCADRLFRPAAVSRRAAGPAAAGAGRPAEKGAKTPDATANAALNRLARAVDAWSKAPGPAAPKRQAALVYINTDALARRMPQWGLADALEHRETGTSFAWNETFRPRPLASEGSGSRVRSGPQGDATGASRAGDSLPARLPEATATAELLPSLEEVARLRQNNAFTDFLTDAAKSQRDARFDRAELMRATLEEDVDAARHAPLDELSPVLLNDSVQLELSNLRLKLLTAPKAEQAAIRARVETLEAAWQQRLRGQEAERLAELARLRSERPVQVRLAGEAAIKSALQEGRGADAALRSELRTEHTTLVNAGFTNPALTIGLPPARFAPQFSVPTRLAGGRVPAVTAHPGAAISFRTFALPLPSEGTVRGAKQANAVKNTGGNRGRQLRLAAQAEAKALARSIARRHGWTLVEPNTADGVYRDETALALRQLPPL